MRLDVELPLHALEHDLEMELPHSADDRLPEFRVVRVNEGRVLLVQLGERVADLLLLAFLVGLDRHGDDGRGEIHAAQNDRVLPGAERVSGMRPLELRDHPDVAAHEIRDFGAILSLHDPDVRQSLVVVARGVGQVGPARDLAAQDAEIR